MENGFHRWNWSQGAFATAQSYADAAKLEKLVKSSLKGDYQLLITTRDIPEAHQTFFRNQALYYIDDQNRCFVHGGFNRHNDFKGQGKHVYCWDRDLWMSAMSFSAIDKKYGFRMKDKFIEVFIGHTATTNWETNETKTDAGIVLPAGNPIDYPIKAANIWNMDTGAGWDGRLTIMDVDTKEYFQSDLVEQLYKGEKGRK
jgi:serine/threonine protein phosphatase 1